MKLKLCFFILLLVTSNISATEQQPDLLLFEGSELTLSTGWGHPSPLETYYLQNDVQNPFNMLHTANYRGFIAHWLITDDKFYLEKISIKDSSFLPSKYIANTGSEDQKVFASWFSGILVCEQRDEDDYWNIERTYYFQVRYGKIVNTQIVTNDDYNRISELTELDTEDEELVEKYKMLILNQNYITYYFRLSEHERIILDSIECKLIANSKNLSPILSLYDNDHLKWKFTWENLDLSGAPNCTWILKDSSLYLQEVQLYAGLDFDSINTEKIELDSLFSEKISNNRVLANWVNGIYFAMKGEEVADENFPSITEFKPSEYILLNIENGFVSEMYNLSGYFNFSELPDDLDPKIRLLINKYFD